MEPFWSLAPLAASLRRKELQPSEVLEETLARMDRLNPALGAVVWRDDDAARAAARAVEERLRAGEDPGPLAGVPLLVKDLTKAAGQPATYGSAGAPEGPAAEDELVVAAFRRAGAVLCGRTNTPELGPLPVTENRRYGVTRNPWDPSRTPGGSSGGSAAAVAAGMVAVAHANDGGGSIRIPASCCGLVGLKPSRWRVPSVTPGWLGCSVEGALVHRVEDAALVLDVISAPDPTVWEWAPPPPRPFVEEPGQDPGSLRVGLVTSSALGLPLAPACREAAERAARALEELGHRVEEVADPLDLSLVEPFLQVVNAAYGDYEDLDWSRVEPHNQRGLAAGRAVDSVTLVSSLRQLRRGTRGMVRRFLEQVDLLVTPTMTIEPPEAGAVLAEAEASEGPAPTVLAMVAFTVPWNLTGQPAMSLPLHQAPSGLPVGVQLVGPPFGEARLLQVAAQLEGALPWGDRHPRVP
jgi:amidase